MVHILSQGRIFKSEDFPSGEYVVDGWVIQLDTAEEGENAQFIGLWVNKNGLTDPWPATEDGYATCLRYLTRLISLSIAIATYRPYSLPIGTVIGGVIQT